MINSFKGEYFFLSNFYPVVIEYNNLIFQSSEAAYQAQKCLVPIERLFFPNAKPGEAKRMGRSVLIRKDWEQVKDRIMREILVNKFSNPTLQEKLLMTRGQQLIEGNHWGDTYWGVYNGKGENKLGKILMSIRDSLKINKERIRKE